MVQRNSEMLLLDRFLHFSFFQCIDILPLQRKRYELCCLCEEDCFHRSEPSKRNRRKRSVAGTKSIIFTPYLKSVHILWGNQKWSSYLLPFLYAKVHICVCRSGMRTVLCFMHFFVIFLSSKHSSPLYRFDDGLLSLALQRVFQAHITTSEIQSASFGFAAVESFVVSTTISIFQCFCKI